MNGTPKKVSTARGWERTFSRTPKEWLEGFQKKIGAAAKADPHRRFHTLMDKVCHPHTLETAWKRVKRNRGVAGIDKQSIEQIKKDGEDRFLEELHEQLRTGQYRVKGVKRVYIPKSSGGKRPLGIPSIADRVVQTAVKLILEPIFEVDFEDCSFGFRPGRSPEMAKRRIYKLLNWGCENVVETDIEAFFDTIPHDRLMKAVERRIADGSVLRLIRWWLKARVYDSNGIHVPTAGTPQGGVLSPLLANIYLDQLDKAWVLRGMEDRRGPDAKLVRYADDLVVLTSKDPTICLETLEEISTDLGLKLKESKTRIVDTRKEPFDFLGFCFRRRRRRGGPGSKRQTVMTPTTKAVTRILNKVRSCLWNKSMTKEALWEAVKGINRRTRGWANYYRHTNARKYFEKVQRCVEQILRKFLRRRRQRSGYGYREYPSKYLYKTMRLYDIRRIGIIYAGGL